MLRRGRIRFEEHAGDEFLDVKRVLKVLSKIGGDTLRRIDAAHDHKGTLHVSWREIPSDEDMRQVERAWGAENEVFLKYTHPDGSEVEVEIGSTIRKKV